jgi:hypothetical protein
MTERDMDPKAQQFIEGLRGDTTDLEADLSVDGLSESVLSRIFGLFGSRTS